MSNFDRDFTLRALESLKLAKRYKKDIFETEIKPFLGKRVMEVGSGIGIFASYIISCNPEIVVLTDVEEMFLRILRQNFESSNVLVRKLDIDDSVDDELISLKIDTVIANHATRTHK
ncbi:MAG: methyltransferase [Thermodesulfovibrio sp.]|nr:methyltransferase [Thermodesulfovibrio sp.]